MYSLVYTTMYSN